MWRVGRVDKLDAQTLKRAGLDIEGYPWDFLETETKAGVCEPIKLSSL